MSLLQVEDVWTAYGPIVVNRGVSIEVDEGEIVTSIGSNGAGKSTPSGRQSPVSCVPRAARSVS